MPTAKSAAAQDDSAQTAPAAAPASAAEPATKATEAPSQANGPAAYQYTGAVELVYVAVPLTARPALPARPSTDDDPGAPATPATVFAWPDGPPDDGRWTPTAEPPNQNPDNEPQPGASSKE
ncbi:hypothetical protein [Kitasatospora sp. NPDC085464]|uniref:hypothetical protein n=1 Tax=Kitasatospora sp. NPDC085464 TaxID=3364063 RepID=UPI0037C7B490